MMHPTRVIAAIFVIICLGAGVAAIRDDTLRFNQDGARNLSQTSTFSSPVNELEQGESENKTLSEFIWDSATDLLLQTWNTTFIAGVAAGDLDPNFYGEYTIQDGAWCREVAKLWRQLLYNESLPEVLRAYANYSSLSYQEYSVEAFEAWHIKDDGENNYGVIPQDAPTNYVNVIRDAMLQYPPNMMIATYACEKLWANVTADLWSYIASAQSNCSNPYQIWVENNMGNSSAIRQAAAMDDWDQEYHWYNWTEAVSLFRTVMQGEINFFNMKTGAALSKQFKARLNHSVNPSHR